jgi:ATP-binding cassette, subfamily C, bacterial LapB
VTSGLHADARSSIPPEDQVDADEVDYEPSEDDALLYACVWLTRHYGHERSAASLVNGLPVSLPLRPQDMLRVLKEADFNVGLIRRKMSDIHQLLLPAVLLLKNGDACIVVRRKGEKASAQYEVIMPGPEFHNCQATEGELLSEYTGYALVASPKPKTTRAPIEDEPAVKSRGAHNPADHWLWGTLKRFIPYYRSSMLAALLSNVFMLVSGIVMSVVYDKVIPHQAFVTLWALASGALIALVFDLLARQLRSHLIDHAGRKADLIIGSLLFRQTLGVRMEHRPESAGAYAHQFAQVETVRDFFTSATLSALSDLPFVVLFVAMIFIVGGPLGWVLVLAIPIIIGLAAIIQGSLRRSMRANMHHQSDLQGVLIEAIEGLEDLKAAGAQGHFMQRHEAATAAGAKASLRARNISAWANNVSMASQQLVTLVMMVWGVHLIHAGVITGGALVGAIMFAGRAVAPLGSLVSLATRYQGARTAMSALNRMMRLPTEREHNRPYVPNHQVTGKIGLHELSFAYPTKENDAAHRVLKNINLQFRSGERVAILGRIGSGKSTILRLLAGLYQPSEGMVEVDGIDLRQIDPADFRSSVGFVSQEPRLFNGTLRDNVLMGRTISTQQLSQVAKITGLDRVISSHPKGWDLAVGEMGSLLSGGQRQLVALARCLVTQPRILLMDEPTSSMDAQSEIMFLRQLKEAVGDCTLIMVTHRPAVLELVTRVMVIDAGKVVLDGGKTQVLAALSGAQPTSTPTAEGSGNVHLHPATQPVQREASV